MANSQKTAIVTGASRGMGAGLAEAFLKRGYNVVANSRNITKANPFAAAENVALVDGDIGDPKTAKKIVDTAVSRFGRIDVLINNAGIFIPKPFIEYTTEDLNALVSTTLAGFLYVSQLAIKQMLRQKSGSIVNISTTLVDQPIAGVGAAVQIMLKGALNAVTRALAIEYAKEGIRVNTIAPGVINTPMHKPETHHFLKGLHPVGRIGEIKEVATEPFAPEAMYELKIDTDGDAIADIAYQVRFSAFERGAQTAILHCVDGPQAAGTGDGGRVIVDRAPVSIGREAKVTDAGDIGFFAGWRSDPFFCDVEGAKNNLQFTGDDFFFDKDVCSIVLEVPNSTLGAREVRLWARTLTPHDGGGWLQVERGARPAQAVILVEERDAYLGGEPATDWRFLASFAHALEHTGGYTSAEEKRVAATLLPDVLPYDPSRPASFPDNGRTLTDDGFDFFMRVLTNGKVKGDNVGPHDDLLLEFPYVGPPHQNRVTKAAP